jgi:transposase
MVRRTFDVVDIIEILVHWHAGRNNSEIAQSLNVDRKTARKYIAVAEAAGMAPGGPPLSEAEWDAKVRAWFPELADTRLRQVTWPAIEPHYEFIREQLKAGVTVTTIHQRLRDEHGVAVSIASFRRYVAANVPEETRRSQVKVLRPWPAEPGAEAQIDYGRLGRWLDPAAGKLVTVWAFVMVLACSRHLFVRPVIRLDQQGWSECHVAAFAFFGGVPARLVPDNLKTGVDRPDLYDPKINRSYAELAVHYGFLPDPARVFRPTDNAICERLAGTLRRELLDRVLITGERHLQAILAEYQAHYNTARPHQGIAQRAPDDKPDVLRRIGTDLDTLQIRRRPVLNGLINEYTHAA